MKQEIIDSILQSIGLESKLPNPRNEAAKPLAHVIEDIMSETKRGISNDGKRREDYSSNLGS